jgi:extensin-like protein
MRRGVVAFSALALFGLGLTGCGLNRFDQREAWRTQAEEACLAQKLVQPSAYMSRMSSIEGPGVCGISHPFKVAAFANGSVGLTRSATLACPMIPTIDAWLKEIVQPAAALYFGASVAEVRSGSYSCRSRNSQRGARLSEHAFGNAVDVMAFRFADGREVSVVRGWRGAPEEQEFLREVFVGACGYFNTVLGPGADMFHHDHFHLDLARHDPRGQRHICKPILKFTPRLGDDAVRPIRKPPSGGHTPLQQQPIDIEADDDPFAVGAAPARTPAGSRPSIQSYASTPPPRPSDARTPGSLGPTYAGVALLPPRAPARPDRLAVADPQRSVQVHDLVSPRADRLTPSRSTSANVAPLELQRPSWTGQGIY